MKKTVFTNAWAMVREIGISFRSALSIAWCEAKLNKLENDWQIASGKAFNYSEEKNIETEMASLSQKLNSIKPCYFCYDSERSNSGAAYYYGVGRYNGD